MKRNQPIFLIFNLTLFLVLSGCGPDETVAVPTAIIGSEIELIPRATAVPTPQPDTQSTPTLAVPQAEIAPSETIPVNFNSIGDPYAPELGNLGYDVLAYDIRLAVDPALAEIDGGVLITAVSTQPLSQFSLDFIGYDISELLINDVPAAFTREDGKIIIDTPQTIPLGDQFVTEIRYSGSPLAEPSRFVRFAPSLGLYFVDNATAYILSEPDGTRYWLPNNDHPRDKALFRFEITVAEGLTAVANGILRDVIEEDGQKTFVWEHENLMAPYLATIAVGEYIRVDDQSPNGVPIRHYVFPENRESFARASSITGEAIDWMSDLFGPYPFETFGFVTADAPGASLETQTMVILSTRMIGQVTVIHEIAHMWFGNWVSLNSWEEMWRNEGFATYISLMWEHRNDPEGLELEMEAVKSAVEENGPGFPLGAPPPELLFSFNTYFGGALMVHELRQTVGDDAFFGGLKLYFERYGGGTATDAEFQAVMEEVYGQSLNAFFIEWLE
ncbi:MAG: M1 family metallopeptidase [Chloroflexota bacterium]